MNILLTNDDGIDASGLRTLYAELVDLGHNVTVFAPTKERSGASNSVTLNTPLYAQKIHEEAFTGTAITGTPVDCVKIGLDILRTTPPDLVISGINAGHNIGIDTIYSGTIAAAVESCISGFPAIAFSRPRKEIDTTSDYAKYAVELLKKITITSIPKYHLININFPSITLKNVKGIKVCPMSLQAWENKLKQKEDNQKEPYWLIEGYLPYSYGMPGTDVDYILNGWITITPLQFDMTAKNVFPTIEQWFST